MKKTSKRKTLVFKVLATSLSLAAILLVLEICARWFVPPYHHYFPRTDCHLDNPRDYYVPLGVYQGKTVYGIPYGRDNDNFRIQDLDRMPLLDVPERPGILALGDSFTVGMGVRYDDIYLNRLSGLLADDGIFVRIENRARVAANIETIYTIYKKMKDPGRYPITLYGFVLNDFGLPGQDRISGVDLIDANAGEKNFDPWRQRLALYNFIMGRLDRRRLSRVTIKAYRDAFKMPYAEGKFRLLGMLADSVRERGSTFVVVLFPLLYDFEHYPFAEAHQGIRKFCEERGIPFLDLFPAFSRYKASDLWCHPTDFHPNEIANKVAAEEIFAFLKKEGLLKLIRKGEGPVRP